MLTSNSSGNMQKHGYLGCFHAASTRENISWVWVICLGTWIFSGSSLKVKYLQVLAIKRNSCRPHGIVFRTNFMLQVFATSKKNCVMDPKRKVTWVKSTSCCKHNAQPHAPWTCSTTWSHTVACHASVNVAAVYRCSPRPGNLISKYQWYPWQSGPGPVSISYKTSYREILWSFIAVRLVVCIIS